MVQDDNFLTRTTDKLVFLNNNSAFLPTAKKPNVSPLTVTNDNTSATITIGITEVTIA